MLEIYHKICEVCELGVISPGAVRNWIRIFNDGQKKVYDEERVDARS